MKGRMCLKQRMMMAVSTVPLLLMPPADLIYSIYSDVFGMVSCDPNGLLVFSEWASADIKRNIHF